MDYLITGNLDLRRHSQDVASGHSDIETQRENGEVGKWRISSDVRFEGPLDINKIAASIIKCVHLVSRHVYPCSRLIKLRKGCLS